MAYGSDNCTFAYSSTDMNTPNQFRLVFIAWEYTPPSYLLMQRVSHELDAYISL